MWTSIVILASAVMVRVEGTEVKCRHLRNTWTVRYGRPYLQEISPNLPSQQLTRCYQPIFKYVKLRPRELKLVKCHHRPEGGLHSNTAVVQNVPYLL